MKIKTLKDTIKKEKLAVQTQQYSDGRGQNCELERRPIEFIPSVQQRESRLEE